MSSDAPAQVRASFGKYRIRGVLGKGGMAKVYLAEDVAATGVRRWNAVKIPDRKYRDEAEYRCLFETERALATRISHPHVCGAFEAGDWNGTPFLAMELLQGRSLLALRKAINPRQDPLCHALRVARVIADACEGLQAIHDFGAHEPVVHRDISPDNLFLTMCGFVKILDLGLAQTELTHDDGETDLLRGKISYIAPELLNRQVATCRSDVWSLGVVAWELLVGRALFNEATDYETLVAVKEQVVLAPSKLIPDLPAAMDTVVLRALQRDPSERFETAATFGAALWNCMIQEGRVIQHEDLAKWLVTLFPAERDAFACLSSIEYPDVVEEICSFVGGAEVEAVPAHAAGDETHYWRSATRGLRVAAAAVTRAGSHVSGAIVGIVARAQNMFLVRFYQLLDEMRAVMRIAPRLGRGLSTAPCPQLLADSNARKRREEPE